jgi:hypothetical protein
VLRVLGGHDREVWWGLFLGVLFVKDRFRGAAHQDVVAGDDQVFLGAGGEELDQAEAEQAWVSVGACFDADQDVFGGVGLGIDHVPELEVLGQDQFGGDEGPGLGQSQGA